MLSLLLIGSGIAWDRARQYRTLHIPPDLRSGAALKVGEVPAASVYAFAYYIFQQLNRSPHSGEKDYLEAIYRLASYMTPNFEAQALADLKYKGRGGELLYRTRAVQEAPDSGYEEQRVEVLGNGVWVVHLDLQIIESVQGMKVKETTVRYPLRVVRYPIDPERNPWGLALDGYAEPPMRLATATPSERVRVQPVSEKGPWRRSRSGHPPWPKTRSPMAVGPKKSRPPRNTHLVMWSSHA